MGLFDNKRALERIEDRLAKIETLAATLEADNRSLKLEYIELYDKVSHQMSRMAKRYARDKADVNAAEAVVPGEGDIPAPDPGVLRSRSFLRSG